MKRDVFFRATVVLSSLSFIGFFIAGIYFWNEAKAWDSMRKEDDAINAFFDQLGKRPVAQYKGTAASSEKNATKDNNQILSEAWKNIEAEGRKDCEAAGRKDRYVRYFHLSAILPITFWGLWFLLNWVIWGSFVLREKKPTEK
jgi:hypothetical protein